MSGSELNFDDFSIKEDFEIVAGTLINYKGVSPYVIIPNTVTILGEGCFSQVESVESVFLSKNITKISKNAFRDCIKLKSITLEMGLIEIGESAFKGCGLEEIIIPDSVKIIGKEAFMWCSSLKKITLPKNKDIIFEQTFKLCSNLTDVDCDLRMFFPSFLSSMYERKKGDKRSTFFDAFQATPFLNSLHDSILKNLCPICGKELNKKNTCKNCNIKYSYHKNGCYIATSVYGSYDCSQVWTLRRYRDCVLYTTWYGRMFVRLYYAISPTLVKLLGNTKWFKTLWKRKLDRMVKKLENQGFENTPYQDIK